MTPRSLGGGSAAIVFPDTRGREVEVRTTSIPVASPARARETCASCRAIQQIMLEDPAHAQPTTCETCGAEYLYRAPTRERVRAPRPIGIGPRPGIKGDADPRVTWVVTEERGAPREYDARVEVRSRDDR